MIDPAFWSDAKITKLPIEARLMFIGLWNFADDYGNFPENTRWILGNIFPNDPTISERKIGFWLKTLKKVGMLQPYESENLNFLHIKRWEKWQKINRPSSRRCPPFRQTATENSRDTHGYTHGVTQEKFLSDSLTNKNKNMNMNKKEKEEKEKETPQAANPVPPVSEKTKQKIDDIIHNPTSILKPIPGATQEQDSFSPEKRKIRKRLMEVFGYRDMQKSYYIEKTTDIMNTYEPELILYACEQALQNNKKSLAYIEAIIARKTGKRIAKSAPLTQQERTAKYKHAAAYLSRLYPHIDTDDPPADLDSIFENDLAITKPDDKAEIIKIVNKGAIK